jgi:hypothetical protein
VKRNAKEKTQEQGEGAHVSLDEPLAAVVDAVVTGTHIRGALPWAYIVVGVAHLLDVPVVPGTLSPTNVKSPSGCRQSSQ